jgi:hypothetical protein
MDNERANVVEGFLLSFQAELFFANQRRRHKIVVHLLCMSDSALSELWWSSWL